ncbi:sialate O-acetylesterase [Rudanella paleaurantiibacter]|nr:sialate O-acetylesterase [Rudanella paleaurantiibacter]
MTKALLTLSLLLVSTVLYAQLTVHTPQSRIVYQRNNQNGAQVPIAGSCPAGANRIEARVEAMVPGQGTATNWTTIDPAPRNGRFSGQLPVRGGWYRLAVRAYRNSDLLAETTVERVGVGEVFIVSGQSNAQGNPWTPVAGASDDRVSVVDFRDENLPEFNLPLTFSQASAGRKMAPNNFLHVFGLLGDRLTARLNVPVLFLGAAYGGTNSNVWRISAQGQDPGGSPGPYLQPYRSMSAALDHYVRRTGVRAILWHQGESDNGYRGQQEYVANVKVVIDKTRQQSGYSRLPWIMSRVSYIGGRTDPAIIAGQNELISTVEGVWPGPETDLYTGPDDRGDGLHFSGNGMIRFADLWNNSLTDQFFNQSQPGTLAGSSPEITTGLIVPIGARSGQTITVPYVRPEGLTADSPFVVRLFNSDGQQLADLGTGTQNPLTVRLPESLPTGTYTVRVDATNPAVAGRPSQPFGVTAPTPIPTTQPGTATSVRRIGYEYDALTHGFNLFVDADGPVEVKVQRLNGNFSDNGWFTSNAGAFRDSYNYTRFYPPVRPGEGGVEPGQYLISARRIGQPTSEKAIAVVLSGGFRTIFPASETTTTTPPVETPATPPIPTTPQTPATTNPTVAGLRKVGYKYDAPTHGFQLLTDADGPVEVRLERLDGPFAETGWGPVVPFTDESGYTAQRFYAPVAPGVGGVVAGRYRLSARLTSQPDAVITSEVTLAYGVFSIFIAQTPATPPGSTTTTTTSPPKTGTVAAGINRLGYKYDAPTHGFQVLVAAESPVQISLERVDGSFSPTDWQMAVSYTEQPGYSQQRLYLPVSPGVGGVVAGTYRIKARLANQPDTEVSVEVVLQYGVFQAYPPQQLIRAPRANDKLQPRIEPGCGGCVPLQAQREY